LEEVPAGGRARVRFGNVTVTVASADVARAGPPPAPPPAAVRGGYTAPESPPVASRLDLRGLERLPALEALEAFLDHMVLQGTSVAEIVHGKGTGVLRRAVAEYLARHPDIVEFRLGEHGEGGSGVTIAKLRSG
jgi:DNA mismatch repair protein MutS2